MKKHKHDYTTGEIVRHRGSFLRSVGWHTDVPINGLVLSAKDMPGDYQVLHVQWSDGNTTRVLSTNVEPDPRQGRRPNRHKEAS